MNQARSEGMRQRWQDPEHRAARKAGVVRRRRIRWLRRVVDLHAHDPEFCAPYAAELEELLHQQDSG
jgi:hypothetical protein